MENDDYFQLQFILYSLYYQSRAISKHVIGLFHYADDGSEAIDEVASLLAEENHSGARMCMEELWICM